MLKAVVDSWQSACDSLGVSDLAFLQRHVEVDSHQNALVLDELGNTVDRKFTG